MVDPPFEHVIQIFETFHFIITLVTEKYNQLKLNLYMVIDQEQYLVLEQVRFGDGAGAGFSPRIWAAHSARGGNIYMVLEWIYIWCWCRRCMCYIWRGAKCGAKAVVGYCTSVHAVYGSIAGYGYY